MIAKLASQNPSINFIFLVILSAIRNLLGLLPNALVCFAKLQRSLCAWHERANQNAKILETVCRRIRFLRHYHHANCDQSLVRIDDEILAIRSVCLVPNKSTVLGALRSIRVTILASP